MQSLLNQPENKTWEQIAPLLDAAIAGLNEKDRHAIVLRFFQNKSLNEIGGALGASEEAAKKRVNRALDRMQKFFSRRGIDSTAAAIAENISANSIQAAPVALAKTVTAVAIAKGAAASASTLTLIKGALKIMAWTKAKTVIVVGLATVLTVGTMTVAITKITRPKFDPANDDSAWSVDTLTIEKLPPAFVFRPTHWPVNPGKTPVVNDDDGRLVAKGRVLLFYLVWAYDYHGTNIIYSPRDFPAQKKYDVMLTLTNQPLEMMQRQIKKQFGVEARVEAREGNWALVVKKTQ